MSAGFHDAGLALDQAPPLSIPLRFFLTAPVFLGVGGALALTSGDALALSRYMPDAIAFTHATTLGVLVMVMFGALYQMAPVAAAAPVPAVGLARSVHAALSLGLVCLLVGLMLSSRVALIAAFAGLGFAWLAALVPMAIALFRSAAADDPTVRGMRLSVCAAFATGVLGIWMAHGHGGGRFPGPRPLFMAVHLGLALLGFVGCLIVAISFQVLPMFYLSQPVAPRTKRRLLHAIAGSVWLSVAVWGVSFLFRDSSAFEPWVVLALSPAAVAVWLVHPFLTVRALRARKRKRADISLRFWLLGMALAPLSLLLGLISVLSDDPRIELLFGWFCLWGWALCVVHGMLYRIVPFLVWFHRLSQLVGIEPVPSAAKLLPDHFPRLTFALHALLLVLGALAIMLRSSLLTRVGGGVLCALSLVLFAGLLHVARYRRPAVKPAGHGTSAV